MRTNDFLHQLDHDNIVKAIADAELLTSGEIRVFVAKKSCDDPVRAAEREFERLGMTQTKERNAVLLYIAPESQAFAVVGDQAIHEKCGQPFWCEVAEAMRNEFRIGHLTSGIIAGVTAAGKALQQHFPRQDDDQNELPNQVEHG